MPNVLRKTNPNSIRPGDYSTGWNREIVADSGIEAFLNELQRHGVRMELVKISTDPHSDSHLVFFPWGL